MAKDSSSTSDRRFSAARVERAAATTAHDTACGSIHPRLLMRQGSLGGVQSFCTARLLKPRRIPAETVDEGCILSAPGTVFQVTWTQGGPGSRDAIDTWTQAVVVRT